MNWASGLFRLWMAGWFLLTAFLTAHDVCTLAVAPDDCFAPMAVANYSIIIIGMIAAIWIVNGFASPRRASESYKPFFN